MKLLQQVQRETKPDHSRSEDSGEMMPKDKTDGNLTTLNPQKGDYRALKENRED